MGNAADDTDDGVHPNRRGDVKMANKWTYALLSLASSLGLCSDCQSFRIMPVGDSITAHNYRFDLWRRLSAAKAFQFHFVGRKRSLPEMFAGGPLSVVAGA